MSNIYRQLGFQTYSDGSVTTQVQGQALAKLGFVATAEYVFHSFCELADYSAVVPFSVKGFGLNCRLMPISGQLGEFEIEYMSMGSREYVVNTVFKATEIGEALKVVQRRIEESKATLPQSKTENPRNDKRYSVDAKIGWYFYGHPCELIMVYFADGTRYCVPKFLHANN